ncbi:MAG: hypothetical protein HFE67_03870, partial [Erysipelotrichaceae bacterium]|nr:hypothetical protein [Erysipelotrichaceae bacterium]
MWKKFVILALSFIGLVTSGYAYYVNQLTAAPSSAQFYEVGDAFKRNGTANSFKMSNGTWYYAYADSATGVAIIYNDTIVEENCPGLKSSIDPGRIQSSNISACLVLAQNNYTASKGADDEMGKLISKNTNNTLTTLDILDLSLYRELTKNETDLSMTSGTFWLKEFSGGDRLMFVRRLNNATGLTKYQNYSNIFISQSNAVARPSTFFVIEIPQKNTIDSITSTIAYVSKPYSDTMNKKDGIITNIDTTSGEGPYQFYVYDTDASGNGNYKNASQYFELVNTDSTNGKTDIKLKDKLPVGDYYFKVKVVDQSTNQKLYYDPGQFENDPFRTKETGVLHVKITKVNPTIAFDIPTQTKKSMTDAATSWNETATATPFNSDLEIKYTITGGDIGLIDLDENTGAVTYKGNSAFGQVTIRATVDEIDPNADNYGSAYAEKTIVIYRELDGVVTPDSTSTNQTTPTFAVGDASVKIGGTIGAIQGILGTPDTIGGSTTTYSYAMKSGSYFSVDPKT